MFRTIRAILMICLLAVNAGFATEPRYETEQFFVPSGGAAQSSRVQYVDHALRKSFPMEGRDFVDEVIYGRKTGAARNKFFDHLANNYTTNNYGNAEREHDEYARQRSMSFDPNNLYSQRLGTSFDGEKLIVVVHGWKGERGFPGSMRPLATAYSEIFNSNSDAMASWGFFGYDWSTDAATGPVPGSDSNQAAEASFLHGFYLGELIKSRYPNVRKVHIIAWSAGIWAARSAAHYLADDVEGIPHQLEALQLTLLDGYFPLGNRHPMGGERFVDLYDDLYGRLEYFRFENLYTDGLTLNTQEEIPRGFGGEVYGLSASDHAKPIRWYADTILRADLDPETGEHWQDLSSEVGFGFGSSIVHEDILAYYSSSSSRGSGYILPATGADVDGRTPIPATGAGGSATSDDDDQNVPKNVRASDRASVDQITVSWDAVPAADFYRVYRSSSFQGPWDFHASTSDPFFVDEGLAPSSTFFYRIDAAQDNAASSIGESDPNVGSTTGAPPAIPQGVSATDGTHSGKVVVTWNAVPSADHYLVYRRPAGGGNWQLYGSSSTNLFEDTPGDSVSYAYRVYASNTEGVSEGSSSDNGYAGSTALDTPSNVSATDGANTQKVTVTWDAVSGATKYLVYRAPEERDPVYLGEVDSPAESYVDSSALSGSLYRYWVRAYSSTQGASELSHYNYGHRKMSKFTEATASTDLSSGVLLTWRDSSEGALYQIFRRLGSSSSEELEIVDSNQFLDDSAVAGVSYYYHVQAIGKYPPYDVEGTGAMVGRRLFAAPVSLTASDLSSTSHVALDWDAVSWAERYKVTRSETRAGTYTSLGYTTNDSFLDTTAQSGETYYYRVFSNSAATGDSDGYAEDSGVRAYAPPSTPTGVTSTLTKEDYVALDWSDVLGATSYRVVRSTTPQIGSGIVLDASVIVSEFQDTTAQVGITYFYFISAVNPGGASAHHLIEGKRVLGTPYVPTGIDASDEEYTDGILIEWNAVDGATTYSIYRSTSWNGYYAPIGTTSSGLPSFRDTLASSGVPYYYKVTATNSAGTSFLSDYDRGERAFSAPPTPLGVAVSDGSSSRRVEISWNAVAGAVRYFVYRADSSGGEYVPLAGYSTTPSLWDLSAEPGVNYYYQVRAAGGVDPSFVLSDPSLSDVGFRAIQVPSVPSGVTATKTNTQQVEVSWNQASRAITYDVYRSTSVGAQGTPIASGLSASYFVDMSAVAGATYYYRIVATNEGGDSAPSSGAQGIRLIPLLPPSAVTATSTLSDRVNVSWESPPSASAYNIYRSSSEGLLGELIATGLTSTSFADFSAEAGVDYFYRIRSTRGVEVSASSEAVGGLRYLPLYVPDAVSASDSRINEVFLTWQGSPGASSYTVFRSASSSTTGSVVASGVVVEEYLDAAATPGSLYYYRVEAFDSVGSSSGVSEPDSGEALIQLATPQNVVASKDNVDGIEVTWEAVDGADSYIVSRNGATIATGVFATTYFDSAADPSQNYVSYQIQAFNGAASGYGGAYPDSYGKVGDEPVSAVQAVYDVNSDSVELTWIAPAWGATGYGVKRGTVDDFDSAVSIASAWSITTPQYFDTSAVPGTKYFYWVQAWGVQGTGLYSASASVSLTVPLPAPSEPDATDRLFNDKIEISWDAVSQADGYRIYRRAPSGGGLFEIGVTDQTTFVDLTATPDIVYEYRIRSYREQTYSEYSDRTYGSQEIIEAPILVLGGAGFTSQIPNHDHSPTVSKGTEFGIQSFGGAITTRTFRIRNSDTSGGIRILGELSPNDGQYSLAGANGSTYVAPGASHDFTVSFSPTISGTLTRKVILYVGWDPVTSSDDPDVKWIYEFDVSGSSDDYGNTLADADEALVSGGSISGEFESGGDTDVFKVEVPSQAMVSFVNVGVPTDVKILASDGVTVLYAQDYYGPFDTRLFLQKGTYYVSMKPMLYVLGNYSLNVDFLVRSDMDGDNRSDLILQHESNNKFVYWYLGDDGSTFGSTGGGVPLRTLNPGWQIVANGDFDFDMSNDLVLQNEDTGRIVIWLMEDTEVVGASSLVAAPGSAAFQVVGTHHFNDDTIPDILWQRDHDGLVAAWLMGESSLLGSLYPRIQVAPIWKLADTADMNLDGLPDAVWQHTGTGMTAVWYLDDTLGFVPGGGNISFQPPSAVWQLTSVEDVNLDGNPDVIYQHQVTGNVVSYLLDGLNVIGAKVLDPQLGTPAWKLRNSRDLE